MLGAAHACANPLTARSTSRTAWPSRSCCRMSSAGTAPSAKDRYAALLGAPRRRARDEDPAETLARRLEDFAVAGHCRSRSRTPASTPPPLPSSPRSPPNSGPAPSTRARSMRQAPKRSTARRSNRHVRRAMCEVRRACKCDVRRAVRSATCCARCDVRSRFLRPPFCGDSAQSSASSRVRALRAASFSATALGR